MIEEDIPLSWTNEDTDTGDHYEHRFTYRQAHLPYQPSVTPKLSKTLFPSVLSFILGAMISALSILQLTQRDLKVNLDRKCALHTSQYCELALSHSEVILA